jgi:hypothetical protein
MVTGAHPCSPVLPPVRHTAALFPTLVCQGDVTAVASASGDDRHDDDGDEGSGAEEAVDSESSGSDDGGTGHDSSASGSKKDN